MRTTAEADVVRLRGVRDTLTLTISGLETSVESLKEELVTLTNNHKKVRAAGRLELNVGSRRRGLGQNVPFVPLRLPYRSWSSCESRAPVL